MSTTNDFFLDDDEFDDSFFEEIDKKLLEAAATSTTTTIHYQPPPQPPLLTSSSIQHHNLPPPPTTTTFITYPPRQPPPPPFQHSFPATAISDANSYNFEISYSPPRELSQRFNTNLDDITNINNNNNNNNSSHIDNVRSLSTITRSSRSPVTSPQLEIDRLKNELRRVSKQLCDLRDECSDLRKERDKERLKLVRPDSNSETRVSEPPLVGQPRNGMSSRFGDVNAVTETAAVQTKIEQKNVGIQTDKGDASPRVSISSVTSTFSGLPNLMSIWSTRTSHRFQRKFVAKLLETCATDFCDLFGCLGLNMTSKMVKECLTHVTLPLSVGGLPSTEAPRLSQLYTVLNKLSNDEVPLDAFMNILLDLCKLENAVVVHRSLRILHVAASYLLSSERACTRRQRSVAKFSPECSYKHLHVAALPLAPSLQCTLLRDNVRLERCQSGLDAEARPEEPRCLSHVTACSNISMEHETAPSPLLIDWFRIFSSVCHITIRLSEEHGMVEAVTLMNIILRSTNPYTERRKFGQKVAYQVISHLLKKEAGLNCQKEAVHLLFLLLNCPDILGMFCSCCKGVEINFQSSDDDVENPSYEVCSSILEDFVDCILCSGYGVKELRVCRNAMVVLAFLASSGESGLHIILYHNLSKRANFLGLILQVLVSEIDAEALESCPAPDISKERTLLMREILILLNRLVSHPAYAGTVLQVLTGSRDMVSLAIDSATRLSKKSRRLLNPDSSTIQIRESEVVDLASQLKKRIFTFLGESL